MIFKYVAKDKKGKKIEGLIEAKDKKEAAKKLYFNNIFYTKLYRYEKKYLFALNDIFKKNISYEKLADFSKTLSLYLNSSIPLSKALEILSSQQSDSGLKIFTLKLKSLIDEGNSFYQALKKQKIFKIPSFYIESVKIAQESGKLQEVLKNLSIYLKKRDRFEKKIKNALIYPLFILSVSMFVLIFMLKAIVPKVVSIIEQMDKEVPFLTKIVIEISSFIDKNLFLIISLFLSIIIAYMAAKKYSLTRLFIDKAYLKIPLINRFILYTELSRFTFIFSTLLSSGVPVALSIKLSSNTLSNAHLRKIFENASKRVVEGKSFAKALVQEGFKYEDSFLQAVLTNETIGADNEIFKSLSSIYSEKEENLTNRFLSLFEPILMLLVGMVVGIIVIGMFLPLTSVSFG